MEHNLKDILKQISDSAPFKTVLSNKRGSATEYNKVVIVKLPLNDKIDYQAEKFTSAQVFHENLIQDDLAGFMEDLVDNGFSVLDAFSPHVDFNVRISKKGKIMFSRKVKQLCDTKLEAETVRTSHNREKNYILREGTIIPPLVDMGIFTKEGRVVSSMQDKYRQINRFLEVVDDALNAGKYEELTIVDFGCGKSYLTFILYFYLTYIKKIKATMIGLDLKAEVIEKCSAAAEKYGYDGLRFQVGDINDFNYYGTIDMVITLHACDTATDYALYNAVQWETKMIFSVPCCQHEVNAQIKSDNFTVLTKYGLVKERISALMTDAIRGSLLEACGYKTQLLEFIDITHTPKNILIRAVKTNVSKEKRSRSLGEVRKLMDEFSLKPTLYELLKDRFDI